MLKQILFGFCATALLIGECKHGPETRQSKVEILATDPTGMPISDVEVELTPTDGIGAKIKTTSGRARVLYGEYQLRAHAKGFGYARRILRFSEPESVARIELSVGAIGCPDPPAEIAGRIRRINTAEELWVKAVPVRGAVGNEARVNTSGYFLISGLEHSTHLVVVMRGETVVYEQIVKTYPQIRPRLEIDLVVKH